jgi:excinuclease ABC subunit C
MPADDSESGVPPTLKEKVRQLPNRPGVYLMKDRIGRIIYVGKAKALKKRVSSYFQPSRAFTLHPKIRALVEMIADFDAVVVKSEPEAILLEGKLIKQWKPRYNTDFTDDKRFLLVRVDPREELPRFRFVRIRKDDQSRYFGPFAHSGPLRKALAQMRRQFGILLSDGTPQKLPDGSWQLYDDVRAEIYGFPNSVTPAEYRERVEKACAFLEGKSREWLASLRAEMSSASGRLEFEKAAALRDIVLALEKTLERPRRFERTDPTALSANEPALVSLQQALGLASPPSTIECFDISHISGTFVVASMVRFADGRPDRDNYRRFRIKGFMGNDDFRAMEEVVGRRYRRLRNEGRAFPDLVVIDGGRGQVGAALKAFVALDLEPPPLVGLAKKKETIVFPDGRPQLEIPLDHPGLRLLQRLRDEAHRFANTYNSDLRSRKIRESLLDDFPGLGPVRRAALMDGFGSIERLRAATSAEIAEVDGFGPRLSAELHAFLAATKAPPLKTP